MSRAQGCVKAGLIALLQRAEIDRLSGGIELLLSLSLSVLISPDDWTGCQNFQPQQGWIWSRGRRVNRDLTLYELGFLCDVSHHPRRDQEFLPRLRISRQENRQNVVIIS